MSACAAGWRPCCGARLLPTSHPLLLLRLLLPPRLFMLEFDRTGIDRFVSLGSPMLPPPEGVIDQVRPG